MTAMPAQPWKSNCCCPVMQKQLVILLTQVRESCAARLLGVEAGGPATVSPAQLAPPTNTGDPWETERPGHDFSFTALRPIPALHPWDPTDPSLLVFLVSVTLKRGAALWQTLPPHPAPMPLSIVRAPRDPLAPSAPTHLWSNSNRPCACSSSTSLLPPNTSHRVSWGSNCCQCWEPEELGQCAG